MKKLLNIFEETQFKGGEINHENHPIFRTKINKIEAVNDDIDFADDSTGDDSVSDDWDIMDDSCDSGESE